MNEIRYFSMFTGVGGFELGLESTNDNESEIKRLQSEKHISSNNSNLLQRTTSNPKSLPKVEQNWEGWNNLNHLNRERDTSGKFI